MVKLGPHLSFELFGRDLVEGDAINFRDRKPPFLQAIFKRVQRNTRIVFQPRKALLLRRRNENPVAEQASCGVMVVRRDTNNIHGSGPSAGPWTTKLRPRSCLSGAMRSHQQPRDSWLRGVEARQILFLYAFIGVPQPCSTRS